MAVTVLGKTFETEEERRAYFRKELRKKLPELKKREGFPIGDDEDIIELSDPPYYTACPNPWLDDFIEEWENKKNSNEKRDSNFHVSQPFSSDISEGKNNTFYNAHSYHTKVPHPAIMKYILHYTQPGDIVFDGFGGTGMTGVAASQLSVGNSLSLNDSNKGVRYSICGDLSPAASLIAQNFTSHKKKAELKDEIEKILETLSDEVGWMYETSHSSGVKGTIDNVVWSDIFLCDECSSELNYWEIAVDYENQKINSRSLECPNCGHKNKRRGLKRKFVNKYDPILDQVIQKAASRPVLIKYSVGTSRYEKVPDKQDLEILKKIEDYSINNSLIPSNRMMEGDESRRNDKIGITHTHHYFTRRNLITMSRFKDLIHTSDNYIDHLPVLTASISRATKMNRFRFGGTGGLSGTLYIPSLRIERAVIPLLESKLRDIYKAEKKKKWNNRAGIVSTQSATDFSNLKEESVDYIFTDPPFGANIYYSELNFITEDVLGVYENIKEEAIENSGHNKSISDYIGLMSKSFKVFHKLLKPGKWMTVEFSNTSAAIWNGIQTSIQNAGFVVSSVNGLDRKQGSFKAVNTVTAVKQDLVISCYKPSKEFSSKFDDYSEPQQAVWEFIEEHLNHLPIHLKKDNSTTAIVERSPKILFDRLVSFYVQKGYSVPLDASKFQKGLRERFIERDGMFFTNEQVQEYDRKKAEVPNFTQLSILVASEQDGVLWLQNFLKDEPKTYQDIQPEWMQALGGERKGDIIPELKTILEENFLKNNAGEWYVPDPDKEEDLEKLRNRRLLKQFEEYKEQAFKPKGNIKECRVEALRAGFKQSYQDKDFETIVRVGDRIPDNLLMEDEVLLQFYDIAANKV